MSQPVAAKQILVHNEDIMFVVDAAGQLWYKHISEVYDRELPWQQITLPVVRTT